MSPPRPAGAGGRERSVLEEEREFFLRSLQDLEAERAAGDIDEVDYLALRDDYTARAAEVLRQLSAPASSGRWAEAPAGATPAEGEDGGQEEEEARSASEAATLGERDGRQAKRPIGPSGSAPTGATSTATSTATGAAGTGQTGPTGGRRGRRRLVWVAGVALGAILLGVGASLVATRRLPGETITGSQAGKGSVEQDLLAAEHEIERNDPLAAVKYYQDVLDLVPKNPTALTGYGAILVETKNATLVARGSVMLAEAESADPSYTPAYAYLGEGLTILGDYRKAVHQLDLFLAHDAKSVLAPQARTLRAFAEKREAAEVHRSTAPKPASSSSSAPGS